MASINYLLALPIRLSHWRFGGQYEYVTLLHTCQESRDELFLVAEVRVFVKLPESFLPINSRNL